MVKKQQQLMIYLLGVLAIAVLLLATIYQWYGFWKNETIQEATEKSLEKKAESENNSMIKVPESLETIPQVDHNTSSSTKPVTVTRTAVSPLTGTLELNNADVYLDVPYTSQAPEKNWEEPWQNACEEAAVLMVDAFIKGYGLSPLSAKDELQRMIAWEKERGWFTSIDSTKVAQLFTDYLGYKKEVTIITNPSVVQIKKLLDAGKPVLALADGKILKNKYYSNGGPDYHAFIIRGYTADSFITNDPGVNRGANFIFPINNVMESLRDWNGGDVKKGTPVIIVVE